jgi:hypothetical protein
MDCEFENMNFSVQHSYYLRRGGHLKSTKTEASAKLLPMPPSLKQALLEWRSQSLYNRPGDFVFASERLKGTKPLDLASVLKKKIRPAFKRIGITGVGWHTFRHTVGSMLAEMGEHQLMIRDYLRHANLHVTNKYLQATTTSKRLARKAGGRHSAKGRAIGKQINSDPIGSARGNLIGPEWTQIVFGGSVNHSKELAGTTGLEPAASAVTEDVSEVTV